LKTEVVSLKHEKFSYKSPEDIISKAQQLKVDIPLSDNIEILRRPIIIAHKTVKNRLVIQPMEGCDSTYDGKPSDLTKRRYQRFAESGAGLIWFEAVAISEHVRANPKQLYISPDNLAVFQKIAANIKETALKKFGFEPLLVMQVTHSGRYTRLHGLPEPVIAYNNPVLERNGPIPNDRIVSDDKLKHLEESYGTASFFAQNAGFDGIDVKSCHGYLLNELLSSYNRAGEYGGSFTNRSKLLINSVKSAKSSVSASFIVTTRLSIYDGFEYPYGFGVKSGGGLEPDLSEPLMLVKLLHEDLGVEIINLTMGNPHVNPHVSRPFDIGSYIPPEHPLEGLARVCDCTGKIKRQFPSLVVVSSIHSYLRKFSANMAAGLVEQGISDMPGFGRESLAYPAFASDLLIIGALDDKKCCVTCGKCSELIRSGSAVGCVIKDKEVYLPIYQSYMEVTKVTT